LSANEQEAHIMPAEQNRVEEARAMQRVVDATLSVQKAFTSLQKQFPPDGDGHPSALALGAFDTALQELEDAQQAFDEILGGLLDGER
jgi:hypothetical protein